MRGNLSEFYDKDEMSSIWPEAYMKWMQNWDDMEKKKGFSPRRGVVASLPKSKSSCLSAVGEDCCEATGVLEKRNPDRKESSRG